MSPAFTKAHDGAAFGAVDLHHEEVVAADAHVPRGVELAEDAGIGLEHGVGRVVGGALVGLAVFADALGDVGGGVTHDFGDFSKEVVDDVAPVTVHVDDDAAAVFFAVVPRRALRWSLFVVTGEDPVTELTTHAQDVSEEAIFLQFLKGHDAGKPKLVLHGAVFDSCIFGDLGDGDRLVVFAGGGLFAIDVLAGSDCFFEEGDAVGSAGGVEEDFVVVVSEGGVEVVAVALDAVLFGEGFDLFEITPGEDGIGHDGLAVVGDSALFANGEDGANEVLIGAHASGDAVHDDTDFFSHSEIVRFVLRQGAWASRLRKVDGESW